MAPRIDVRTQEKLQAFSASLKQGSIMSYYDVAMKTIDLLKRVISQSTWKTAGELIDILKTEGHNLVADVPSETTVGNIVRRVLKIVREEYDTGLKGHQEEEDTQESLTKMLKVYRQVSDYDVVVPDLTPAIMDSISELVMEIETSYENIATQALEHIHTNEIIMTFGQSKTVEAFLKEAAKGRKFQVIVAECAPSYNGQDLACRLASYGIQTTVITDSAIFAMMSRVNKVLIGTHTVFASGGLAALNGAHTLALAAKYHSVPLIVCAPMFKLTPQYLCSHTQEGFNQLFNRFSSPEAVLPFCDGETVSKVHTVNPVFDFVPDDLVTLFISNLGGHATSYVYRLLTELYHPDDYEI